MNGDHLLDTNIIVAMFKGDAQVLAELAASPATYVPVISVGELLYGALHSSRVQQNLAQVQSFAGAAKVLPCDVVTAEFYGQIKNDLQAKGHPIPENDVWIAALARQHGLTLVSRDKHFQQVTGLVLVEW